MKILVDNALSPQLANLLVQAGHDVVHLRDRIVVDSPDEKVFELAKSEERIILSADTDFGAILANRSECKPSFILLRHDAPTLPHLQAELLCRVLEVTYTDLEAGSIVSGHCEKIRVRRLPIR